MREVCFLIDADGDVLWRDDSGTPSALPDSRARWEAIWTYRAVLAEIAHSHPSGLLRFSTVDLSTMDAIDAALGRSLAYAVVTDESVLRRGVDGATLVVDVEPGWVVQLRAASDMG